MTGNSKIRGSNASRPGTNLRPSRPLHVRAGRRCVEVALRRSQVKAEFRQAPHAIVVTGARPRAGASHLSPAIHDLRTVRDSSIVNMAGPSAADVRSILSLPNPSAPGPSQPRKQPGTSERARKPEGISRELYSLIGPSAPTIAAQLAKPRLKQKPNLGGGGRVKWCAILLLHSLSYLMLSAQGMAIVQERREDRYPTAFALGQSGDGPRGRYVPASTP